MIVVMWGRKTAEHVSEAGLSAVCRVQVVFDVPIIVVDKVVSAIGPGLFGIWRAF